MATTFNDKALGTDTIRRSMTGIAALGYGNIKFLQLRILDYSRKGYLSRVANFESRFPESDRCLKEDPHMTTNVVFG